MRKVLFICSRNKWRSRTAETIYKKNLSIDVKSAGTENNARIKVNESLIVWADIIFVMEKRHKERLNENFKASMKDKEVVVLDILDNYKYMDEELIEELKLSVADYLD